MSHDRRVLARTTAWCTKLALHALIVANGMLAGVQAQTPGGPGLSERRALPAQAELDAAEQSVTERFALGPKGPKRPADKLELAEKLLSASADVTEPARRFVILRHACDLRMMA